MKFTTFECRKRKQTSRVLSSVEAILARGQAATIAALCAAILVICSVSSSGDSTARAIKQLGTQLEGRDARAASLCLSAIGSRAVPEVNLHLQSKSWTARYWAVACLGQIGGKRVYNPIEAATLDPDWRVKISALLAYSEAGRPHQLQAGKILAGLNKQNIDAVREAFRYAMWMPGSLDQTRKFCSDFEHSTVRIDDATRSPGSEIQPYHDSFRQPGIAVHIYSRSVDGDSSAVRVLWVRGNHVSEQHVELPDGWYMASHLTNPTYEIVPLASGKCAAFVMRLRCNHSGNVDMYAPAIFDLSPKGWQLLNENIEEYQYDALSGCFVEHGQLYLFYGDGGQNTKLDPQKFNLRVLKYINHTLVEAKLRTKSKLYIPHGKIDPLREFGLRSRGFSIRD
jgi:hypothetical protein